MNFFVLKLRSQFSSTKLLILFFIVFIKSATISVQLYVSFNLYIFFDIAFSKMLLVSILYVFFCIL